MGEAVSVTKADHLAAAAGIPWRGAAGGSKGWSSVACLWRPCAAGWARSGRLYLTGLEPSLTERLVRTGHVEDGPVRTFEATPIVGESTQRAYLDAEAWLVKRRDG
jgi:hypothetical protein